MGSERKSGQVGDAELQEAFPDHSPTTGWGWGSFFSPPVPTPHTASSLFHSGMRFPSCFSAIHFCIPSARHGLVTQVLLSDNLNEKGSEEKKQSV